MISTGGYSGLDATITRPDGTMFNGYDVISGIGDEWSSTKCWLECEDDSVFQINIRRHVGVMKRFSSSSWSIEVEIDGKSLGSTLWRDPAVPFVKESHITQGPGQILSGSPLTFGTLKTTARDDLVTTDADNFKRVGEIYIVMTPVKVTTKTGQLFPADITPIASEVIIEGVGKGSMAVKLKGRQVIQRPTEALVDCEPLNGDLRHEFKFKYRHLAELKGMGVVNRPIPAAAGTKRITDDVAYKDWRSDFPQVGPRSRTRLIKATKKHFKSVRPRSYSKSNSVIDYVVQDKKPEVIPVVSSGNTGLDVAEAQTSDVKPDVEGIDTGHHNTTQTPLPVTQALARLSVNPESANVEQGQVQNRNFDTSLDEKPDINALAEPSPAAGPQRATHDKELDSEEDSEREQDNLLWEIRMHQKAIERLQRVIEEKGKGKGKGKK